ncbi:MAG: hypothetical protein JRI56_04690 [Deltaproteobacteria bacterium]|nr:hypothetical protein [Deltaproteobacteria bacterium]
MDKGSKRIAMVVVFGVLMILAFAISSTTPSSVASGMWPDGYRGFEFEVVSDSNDRVTLRVTVVHDAPGVDVGDIYQIPKPDISKVKLRFSRFLGWDERGFYVAEFAPEVIKKQQTYYMEGTVDSGYLDRHGYYYLFITQLVEIECYWSPGDQTIWLGLYYWAYNHFYYASAYGGHDTVYMYPPYNGYYSIGVANPPSNQYTIDYHGWYTIYPADI